MKLYILHTIINYFLIGFGIVILVAIRDFGNRTKGHKWYKILWQAIQILFLYPYMIWEEIK